MPWLTCGKLWRMACLLWLLALNPLHAAELPSEDGKLAEIRVQLLDGQRFELAEHKGKLVLVAIWASWCPICLGELPQLDQYYRHNRQHGFEIIALSLDNNDENIRAFVEQAKLSFPVARRNAPGSSDNLQKIIVTPIFYLLNKDGKVLWRRVGPVADRLPSLN